MTCQYVTVGDVRMSRVDEGYRVRVSGVYAQGDDRSR